MAANQPLKLVDYLKENASDLDSRKIDDGIKQITDQLYLTAPSKLCTLSTHSHFSTQYKQKQEDAENYDISSLATSIGERSLHDPTGLYLKGLSVIINHDNTYTIIPALKNSLKTAEDKRKALFICHRASIFEQSALGNCSHRACYAALELKALVNDKFDIFIKNIPRHDQYVIYIRKSNSKEFYIYDPLLNPDLIFAFEDYRKNILPLYPQVNLTVASLPTAVEMKVTPELIELCKAVLKLLRQTVINEITTLDSQPLIKDCILKSKWLKLNSLKSYEALLEESVIFLKQRISPSTNPCREQNRNNPNIPAGGVTFFGSAHTVPEIEHAVATKKVL